jgi:hypothetical protein
MIVTLLKDRIVFNRHQTVKNRRKQGGTYVYLFNNKYLFKFSFAKHFATMCTNEYYPGLDFSTIDSDAQQLPLLHWDMGTLGHVQGFSKRKTK